MQKSLDSRFSNVPDDMFDRDDLLEVARRLKNVQILNRDGLAIIEKFLGTGALIYFDPPYVLSSRARGHGYTHEVSDEWHCAAGELLKQHNGPVIIAGYESALYDELFNGWRLVRRSFQTNGGSKGEERLWLNEVCVAQLVAESNKQVVEPLQLNLLG
jgi:DNA adenine methylase